MERGEWECRCLGPIAPAAEAWGYAGATFGFSGFVNTAPSMNNTCDAETIRRLLLQDTAAVTVMHTYFPMHGIVRAKCDEDSRPAFRPVHATQGVSLLWLAILITQACC